jgi:hypothetical protein
MKSRPSVFAARFRVAIFVAILLSSIYPARPAGQTEPNIKEKCATLGGDAVSFKDSQNPEKEPTKICADELKQLSCQPLALLRNYLLFSYGVCFNRSPTYKHIFSRPGCESLSAKDYDDQGYDIIPDADWKMISSIKSVEIQKDCANPDYMLAK